MSGLSPRCKRWINCCFEYLEETGYGVIQNENKLQLAALNQTSKVELLKPEQLITSTQLSELMDCMKQVLSM